MTNNQATLDKLDRMRLHGMARALRTSLETQSQCTADELLARLVDAEWDDRHERRLQRLLKAARFRYPAAIEEVDFALHRNLDRNQLLRLADCRWVQHHQDLIITGKCGSGKSFLASALGHQACLRGFRVGYHASSRLFGQLRLAKADGSYVRELEKISKQALVIIDLSRPCDYPDESAALTAPSRVGCRRDRDNPAPFLDPLIGGAVCSGRRRTDGNAVMEERSWAAGPVCGRVPGSALEDGSFSGLSEAPLGVDGPVESLAHSRGSRRRRAQMGSCPAVPGSSTRGRPTARADAGVIDAAVRLPKGVECSCSGSGSRSDAA